MTFDEKIKEYNKYVSKCSDKTIKYNWRGQCSDHTSNLLWQDAENAKKDLEAAEYILFVTDEEKLQFEKSKIGCIQQIGCLVFFAIGVWIFSAIVCHFVK